MAGPLAVAGAFLGYNGAVMKLSLIIPLAFIAGVVMSGCSSDEDESTYQPLPGETAIEGEEEVSVADSVGSETMEPL